MLPSADRRIEDIAHLELSDGTNERAAKVASRDGAVKIKNVNFSQRRRVFTSNSPAQ